MADGYHENSRLLSENGRRRDGDSSYYGSDAVEREGAYQNTAFVPDDTIHEEPSKPNKEEYFVSADELLHLMHFAFLNKEFDAHAEISRSQNNRHGADKITFKEKILDGLKTASLPIRVRLKIHKLLIDASGHRRPQNQAQQYIRTKQFGMCIVVLHHGTLFFNCAAFVSRGNYRLTFIWEKSINSLAAYFGSNVASYFTFVRTLFLMNLVTGLIFMAFTTVPMIISGTYELVFPSEFRNISDTGHFGILSKSLMFYGAYQETSDNKFKYYSVPKAYLLTWAIISVVTLITIVISMQVRYRRSKHAEQGDDYPFTWSMFCSWDHTIYRRSGVKNRLKSFCTELKERIREEKSFKVVSICKRVQLYGARIFSNIVVLALLGGSGVLIYYVESEFTLPEEAADFLANIFEKYRLAVVVSVLKFIVPFLFQLLILLEGWHPRVEQKITIARTTFFYYASLVIFMLSLTDLENCTGQPINTNTTANDPKPTESTINSTYCCWENEVGEEVFKVILVDLGLCIAVGLFVDVTRAIFVKYDICCKKIGYKEFSVTPYLLDLIYGQGLVWLGLYFSPLLALAGAFKLLIVFYFRYFVAKVANVPPKKMFKASRSGNFYLFLLLTTWFLCIVPVGYFLVELTPSWHCGPFRRESRVYDILGIDLTNVFTGNWRWIHDALSYIGTAIVVVPLIVVLLLIILYYYTKASSYSNLVKELRKQLIFERKVERKTVFAKALSAPAGSIGRASGTTLTSLAEEE